MAPTLKGKKPKKRLTRLARFSGRTFAFFRPGKLVAIFGALTLTLLVAPAIAAFLYFNALVSGPLPDRALNKNAKSLILYDTHGEEIGIRGPHRRSVQIEELPDHTLAAFIAIEDRRFHTHSGIDLFGIVRALKVNMQAKAVVEGGSTITQQLVKNIYLGPEQTLDRKWNEALFAMRLEKKLSKEEILEQYLYTVYFGNNAYGIEAAAETYFGKHASELTVAESAILAGSIKAPGRHAPHIDPEYAKNRGHLVLDAMTETGALPLIDAELARFELDRLAVLPGKAEPQGYFLDYASRAVTADVAVSDILHVHTTFDPTYQALAEKAIDKILDAETRKRFNVTEAALVAMRPSGEIIALVGGTDYTASQFNRATQAKRQPGSLFKVFVYDAALRQGWLPEDLIVDSPMSFEVIGQDELYQPSNYNNRHLGLISTRKAFASSTNSAALRLQEWTGREHVIEAAKRAGLDAKLAPYASLGLGVTETTLLDVTAAYASLAANQIIEPYALKVDRPHQHVQRIEPSSELLTLLRDNVQAGTGYSSRIDVPSFGKTGTTQDYRDAWYVGFTDHLIVGVWVGNDNYEPMKKVTGGTLPTLIWKEFSGKAHRELQKESGPERFSPRPLLDIAADYQRVRTSYSAWDELPQKVLGPVRVSESGMIEMGEMRIYLEHVQTASPYGSYYSVFRDLKDELVDIEAACEIYLGYATCQTAKGDLAEHLLEEGWARTSYGAPPSYRDAEERAREAGKGIWSDDIYRSYAAYDVYDFSDLTWRQRQRLEQQRRRDEERLRQQRQQQNNGTVTGRSAVGETPIGSTTTSSGSSRQGGVVGRVGDISGY